MTLGRAREVVKARTSALSRGVAAIVLECSTPAGWRLRLAKHHASSTAVLRQIEKAPEGAFTYAEALDVALARR